MVLFFGLRQYKQTGAKISTEKNLNITKSLVRMGKFTGRNGKILVDIRFFMLCKAYSMKLNIEISGKLK